MASDKDTVQDALERFKESQEASDYNRNNAEDDIAFARMADQWPEKVRKQREREGRPCLTINRLPSFIRQVVNDSRQNKPGIVVGPVDGGADENTAHVIGGLIRSIERGSNAEIAYDTAIDHAVSGGFGFFRINIDYAHAESFDLEARIERIPNPLMVHWDPNSTEFDASDWEYAFVSDWLTEEQFEQRYPDAEKVSWEGDPRDTTAYWLEDDKIRIAEYWHRSEKRGEIVLLSDGRVVRADKLGDYAKGIVGDTLGNASEEETIRAAMAVAGVQEMKRRETAFHDVTRYITNGSEILETDPWPGSTIPICPVWGEEVYHEGRRHFRSMIRDARDPQTMFNFWRSASTELVALAPRAPFVIDENALPTDDKERGKWLSANNRSHPYLLYKGGGNAPRREPFAGVPAGALQESLNASDDMKAIIGIYDPSLGARSNETSGKAILARQKEADVSNFHFVDNLSRAIRYAGRVLVDIIPAVYGPRETIRILGEDMAEQVIKLTQATAEKGEDGEPLLYNLAVGKYDVTVKTGPSYATQREEAREVLIEIMRSVQGAGAVIGDLLADNLDFVGADKLKERLRLLLPPQIQQAEGIAPVAPQGMPGQPPMANPNPGQGLN